MPFAIPPKKRLSEIATIDEATISAIAKLVPSGYIHPSTHPASMIVESSDRNFVTQLQKNAFHASGSDDQDLSGLVVKETGKSLVDDNLILLIHEAGSDNQDLSNLVTKVTGKGLSTEDYTTAEKEKLAGLSNSGGLTQAQILARQL